jgi:hypothetical protein
MWRHVPYNSKYELYLKANRLHRLKLSNPVPIMLSQFS